MQVYYGYDKVINVFRCQPPPPGGSGGSVRPPNRRGTGRHSRVLTASRPDNPEKSLSNLGASFNSMLDQQRYLQHSSQFNLVTNAFKNIINQQLKYAALFFI